MIDTTEAFWHRRPLLCACLLGFTTAVFTQDISAEPKSASAPAVGYVLVKHIDAARTSERFGRVEALREVDIRSRVSGTLEEWLISEGDMVEQGQLLARIEDSVYRANVAAAQAELDQARATLELARLEQQRLTSLIERKVAAQSELDAARALQREAQGRVKAMEAQLELAQIDLDYTEVLAPFAGKVGLFALAQGSYVNANEVLSNLVQLDPVRVGITVSESQFIDYRRRRTERDSNKATPQVTRRLRLADGSDYEYDGDMVFAGNQLNPETASLPLYLEFPNPQYLLVPGQFVFVLSAHERPEPVLAVPLASIVSDAAGDYVLVIDSNDTVQRRDIDIAERTAALALLKSGLVAGEKVIVQGLTRARIGGTVDGEPAEESHAE